jgi:hypothetical protein
MASDDSENRPAPREEAQLVKPTKATEKRLVEKIKAKVGESVVNSFKGSTAVSFYHETRTIQDMTSETVTAMVESSRNQYAVPEQERTARAVQQTIRLKIASAVVVLGIVAGCLRPEAGGVIVGAIGILGTGIVSSEFFNREKRKDPSRTPKG